MAPPGSAREARSKQTEPAWGRSTKRRPGTAAGNPRAEAPPGRPQCRPQPRPARALLEWHSSKPSVWPSSGQASRRPLHAISLTTVFLSGLPASQDEAGRFTTGQYRSDSKPRSSKRFSQVALRNRVLILLRPGKEGAVPRSGERRSLG